MLLILKNNWNSHTLLGGGGRENSTATLENSLAVFLIKLKIHLSYKLIIQCLDIYPQKWKHMSTQRPTWEYLQHIHL